jgi:hypothetical protein
VTIKSRILELAKKVKNPPSWWWKLLGGILLAVMVVQIHRLLKKRAAELAIRRDEINRWKLDAEQAAVAAKVETNLQRRMVAEVVAEESLKAVRRKEEELNLIEEEHRTQMKLLQAVANKDWTALNKLAGVKL